MDNNACNAMHDLAHAHRQPHTCKESKKHMMPIRHDTETNLDMNRTDMHGHPIKLLGCNTNKEVPLRQQNTREPGWTQGNNQSDNI